eukprot:COSAG04_NODE_6478_length_1318_cov_1.804758_1_plen_100_part_00
MGKGGGCGASSAATPKPTGSSGAAGNKKVIVMSCPEEGTLDPFGGPPYDQKVMDKIEEMQQAHTTPIAMTLRSVLARIEKARSGSIELQKLPRTARRWP